MKSLIALVFALSMMVPVAANAGWGVIAVDDQVGEKDPAYGVGGGDSKAEATKNAMKFCKEASGKNCDVAVAYEKCGAYASSRKYSGTGTASTAQDAKKKALVECNNASCKVLIADCN
ncbi:MAG TPA: DUF4189 domain-containing protein [Casimicrobiaceae bacterium]|jgi:Domain of unknown function (DUF4189)|nr:DUF4189 domain-containing protein [Casimicrobiaceae bacterium]